jgi:hypothetical protein
VGEDCSAVCDWFVIGGRSSGALSAATWARDLYADIHRIERHHGVPIKGAFYPEGEDGWLTYRESSFCVTHLAKRLGLPGSFGEADKVIERPGGGAIAQFCSLEPRPRHMRLAHPHFW